MATVQTITIGDLSFDLSWDKVDSGTLPSSTFSVIVQKADSNIVSTTGDTIVFNYSGSGGDGFGVYSSGDSVNKWNARIGMGPGSALSAMLTADFAYFDSFNANSLGSPLTFGPFDLENASSSSEASSESSSESGESSSESSSSEEATEDTGTGNAATTTENYWMALQQYVQKYGKAYVQDRLPGIDVGRYFDTDGNFSFPTGTR